MSKQANIYWQRTRRLTFRLLICWMLMTFGMIWYARELNSLSFIGFPLGFYMAAQGSLFVFLLIIWWYNRGMKKVDAEFGIEDE